MQFATTAAAAGIHIKTMYSHSDPPRQIMVSTTVERRITIAKNTMNDFFPILFLVVCFIGKSP